MKTKFSFFAVVITCLLLALTFNCKKDPPKAIPTLSTTVITDLTPETASSGGSVTSDGGSAVTAREVCWSPGQTHIDT